LKEEVLDVLLEFARHLVQSPSRVSLLHDLLHHVFFNPDLWIHTDAKIQLKLLSSLTTEFVVPSVKQASEPIHEVNVRQQLGVPWLLYVLKHYYWIQLPVEAAKGIGSTKSCVVLCFVMCVCVCV
jgi:hypothetical protein